MGVGAGLFYNPDDPNKQTLHRRVKPTDAQFDEQQERWNGLADYLKADLKKQSGYEVSAWLQGSYKFGTQVRPPRLGQEFDIDLGVYFAWEGEPEDGERDAKDTKTFVQKSLQAYVGDDVIEVVVPPKARCSRIRFKGDFHIDVPAYHLDPGRDIRTLATEEGEWERSDPKALYLWFKNKSDDYKRDKVRRYVRYFKSWAGLKFTDDGRPSSTLITVLVAEAAYGTPDDKLASDDEALLAILEQVVARLETNKSVPNPIDGNEDLAARFTDQQLNTFQEKLCGFRNIAQVALQSETLSEAADKWSEAFEHFFPMPEAEEVSRFNEASRRLPVPIAVPDVTVRAISRTNRNLSWNGRNRIGPIPKDCDIYFELTNLHVFPFGVEIEWMVRNEGEEAEYTNDLGHIAGQGIRAEERKERSAYKGTHYMDCAVKQHGRLIAVRRILVEITGTFAPRRNPAKRRFWVRELIGRR